MTSPAWCTSTRQAMAGLLLTAVLASPWPRQWLEASMWRHMLLQFPLWMLAGALLCAVLPTRARSITSAWNSHGIAGLIWVGMVLSVLMVPRVLDLALRDMVVEAVKCTALLLAGTLLRLSWRPAGLVVQCFFLGMLLPMMVVVGQLYIDSPLRLCNAYLLDDQERLGRWLIALAALLASAWLAHAAWLLVRRDEGAQLGKL